MLKANRKAYFVDNGIRNLLTLPRYLDKGNLLENLVFLELIRRGYQCFFFKNKKECDFIAFRNKEKMAVQVCFEINEKNEEREVEGLLDAMEFFNLKKGLILTFDQERIKTKKTIEVKSAWRWILETK
jgi:predicted AAA+ superfamily ATPase